ncbi:MAG: hypothetical protein IJ582_02870 [Prevotella sp.]|nr:hypothetical protein [Prevotella sp.]
MKRLFLVVVAMLSMTMTFAEDEHLKNVNNVSAYKMDVNYDKLGEALSLTRDQMEAVKDIHQAFCADMMSVAAASKESQKAMMKNAISKDLGFMRIVLNEKQYKLYLRLLNTTINNRGLNMR